MKKQKRHIGQEILPTISHYQGTYRIENVRDFERETEHAAKQHFSTMDIQLDHITGCSLYQSLFGFDNLLAHYMLWFHIQDPETKATREVILSIEARRPAGDNYSLWKGIIPKLYGIIYIWGTHRDLIGLRNDIWKEPAVGYTMKFSATQAQNLFRYFSHRTNSITHTPLSYNAIAYNCLTDLHLWIHNVRHDLPSHTIRTILAKWYLAYSQKKWVTT